MLSKVMRLFDVATWETVEHRRIHFSGCPSERYQPGAVPITPRRRRRSSTSGRQRQRGGREGEANGEQSTEITQNGVISVQLPNDAGGAAGAAAPLVACRGPHGKANRNHPI